jgi:hypothetical protein
MVFGQTAAHRFVNLDDGMYVHENSRVCHGFTVGGLAWAFARNESALWVPLTWLSLMLDGQLYGLNAGGYHLTSVLLHAATAVVLFRVLHAMTGQTWPSALVAALFAVHPLRAESVAWVTERKDVLSALLFMLMLAAYVGYVRRPFSLVRYLGVVTLFFLGLTAKPILVTAPLVLLLLDFWPLGQTAGKPFRTLGRLLVEKIPLLALTAGSCLVTVLAQSQQSLGATATYPLGWRIGHALISYLVYFTEFFWPAGLVAMYPWRGFTLPAWRVLAALAILVGVTVASFLVRRRCPYCLIGWLWYLGMLVPVIGLVQVGAQAMPDRFTYLPQIGLSVALVWPTADFCRRRPRCRLAGSLAAALALAVLTGCGWRQTCFWRDSETLWNHALALDSSNEQAHDLLGAALVEARRYDEALVHYRRALEIGPNYSSAYNNLAWLLATCPNAAFRNGDEAIRLAQRATELSPHIPTMFDTLAAAYAEAGRFPEALVTAHKALELATQENNRNLAEILWTRIALYEAGKPYHETLSVAAPAPAKP